VMSLHHSEGKASTKLLKVRQPLTLVKWGSWSRSRNKPSSPFWSSMCAMTILVMLPFDSLWSILIISPKPSQLAVRSLLVWTT